MGQPEQTPTTSHTARNPHLQLECPRSNSTPRVHLLPIAPPPSVSEQTRTKAVKGKLNGKARPYPFLLCVRGLHTAPSLRGRQGVYERMCGDSAPVRLHLSLSPLLPLAGGSQSSGLNLESGRPGATAPGTLNVRQNAASETPPLPDLRNPLVPFDTSSSPSLNVPRNESPPKMRALTQSRVAMQRLFLTSTQVLQKWLVHGPHLRSWVWPLAAWGCGDGGVGERVPRVAQKPSVPWFQTSPDSDVFRLGKPSAGSEGKAQKATSAGAKLGSSPTRKHGVCTHTQAHTRRPRQQPKPHSL